MVDERRDTDNANLNTHRASADERAEAARRWPELGSLPEPQEIWVARDARDGSLRGAGALDLYPLPFRMTGRALRLYIDDASDGAVGAALVGSAEETVRELGLKAVFAGDSAAPGSDAWLGWQSLGFAPNAKLGHYQVELAAYLSMLTPLYDALTVRGRVPIEARIIPLGESPIGEVIQLQIEHIGGEAGRMETRLRGAGHYPFHPSLSRVAMIDDRVGAILLAQVDRYRRLTVESKVVAPTHRRGWMNIALMQEAAQAAVREGFTRVRFLANEQQQDTHRLAAKAGNAMQRRDVMMRLVGADPAPISA